MSINTSTKRKVTLTILWKNRYHKANLQGEISCQQPVKFTSTVYSDQAGSLKTMTQQIAIPQWYKGKTPNTASIIKMMIQLSRLMPMSTRHLPILLPYSTIQPPLHYGMDIAQVDQQSRTGCGILVYPPSIGRNQSNEDGKIVIDS